MRSKSNAEPKQGPLKLKEGTMLLFRQGSPCRNCDNHLPVRSIGVLRRNSYHSHQRSLHFLSQWHW
jgi:hypothetical protein